MESLDEKRRASGAEGGHVENVELKDVSPASEALAAAVASQKPDPWSRNMLQLYSIMSIGYLVSTMNGFGEFLGQLFREARPTQLFCICSVPSWICPLR